ncbi:MAG: hypothetical protein J5861_06800 [Desulfovibrio sp.]|nr:hypothetical protein [Desulfovibrio sp.]
MSMSTSTNQERTNVVRSGLHGRKTHYSRLLFDPQDYKLIQMVNNFVAARARRNALPPPESDLHPNGIIEMTSEHGLRLAAAVIVLLESLAADDANERIRALRRLHDEVLYSTHSSLQNNTARVLVQIMKNLVRSSADQVRQLPLAHEFHSAVRGAPRVIRSLLRKYHLLEMPEEWNQQAFDHHVHDANTKGRKNPTHLIMDAWIKGIRFLTVIYYNTVDPEAARELLTSARIMGITVRIGIEFKATYRDKIVELTWSPLNINTSKALNDLLQRHDIAELLQAYAPINDWMRGHVLTLLHAWNSLHSKKLSTRWDMPALPPLDETAFLAFVGKRQPSALHLAEYIYQQLVPMLRKRDAQLRDALENEKDAEAQQHLRLSLDELEAIVPDMILEDWLSPKANPDIVFPSKPQPGLPEVLLKQPEILLENLHPLHPCQFILNLSGLTPQDVLELLWRGRGRITHLEVFNLRQWTSGQLTHAEEINALQRAINEGSTPRLKQIIRQIIESEPQTSERMPLFRNILDNIPQLQEFYALAPLGSRVGTDSTSLSHHTHGMGLIFVETLPPKARSVLRREKNAQRLTLPVHTDMFSYVQHHEPQQPLPFWQQWLRRIPGMEHWGCQITRGWELEKKTTRFSKEGNLVTLGGVDNKGLNRESRQTPKPHREHIPFWSPTYMNTNLSDMLKVLAGFLPAQWAFCYVDGWWVLTWFGALIWYLITFVRNVAQSVVGGGAFTRSLLVPWKRYVSWSRMADSLLYTGISVPLLEVVVRLWLLQDLMGITVQNNAFLVYTVIAFVNSFYISGHNIYRGLQKEAIIGNFFRSALSIPLSMVMGEGLLFCFEAMQMPEPVMLLQNCAAIVSKCSSDLVAAVIEGFADRNSYLRMRQCDYDSKLTQIYASLARQELIFPHRDIESMLRDPSAYWNALYEKDPAVARQAVVHLLDMMYMWYYQPRAREVFWRKMCAAPPEERGAIMAMHALLTLEREISTLILDGLLNKDFARALAFYLQKNRSYVRELRREASCRLRCTDLPA